jgi:hypothetical protein
LLANLVLLFWRKDFVLQGTPVSPWNREFKEYLIVSAAFVVGSACFFQGDLLVANKFFSKEELDAYTAAGILARALPMTVSPMLAVLFTARSGQRAAGMAAEQFKLATLSGLALVLGAVCLFMLRTFCLKLLNKYTPEAAAMVGQFATTMVFVGLLQSFALWALASRWMKISLLYGGLGLAYWITLLGAGKSPAKLLLTMPIASGLALGALLAVWFVTLHRSKSIA